MSTTLIISDAHIGSTVALCKPIVTLDDGGSYKASAGQSWLWHCWEDMIAKVAQRQTGPLYTIFNGDMIEGDTKNRSLQMISRNPATILSTASDILEPLTKLSEALFFMRGTAAHGGQSANLEEQLAADLGGQADPATGAHSWWHLQWSVDDICMDIAHHPGIGVSKVPAATYGGIDRLAVHTEFAYVENHRQPPHLVIRSHNHTYRDSFDHYRTRAITTPAWTLATEYIHRIAPGALADIGAVMVHTSAGYYEVEPIRFKPAQSPIFTVGDIKHGDTNNQSTAG